MTPSKEFTLHDPHSFLGIHPGNGKKNLYIYRPGAKEITIQIQGKNLALKAERGNSGLFKVDVSQDLTNKDYCIYHHSGLLAHDPYAFLPTIGEMDLYLFGKGVHYNIYEILGAHRILHQDVWGVRFAIWAPGAENVSLIADFNHWDPKVNPMRSLGASGIWELFVPGITFGEKYKFEITTQNKTVLTKTDPYAYQLEHRPKTASIVASIDTFNWSDQNWMNQRIHNLNKSLPMNIYEIHAGSWRRPYGRVLNYRELAVELANYCIDMGYTHVEFLPIQEHPLDESWGYQVTGYYAVTSRYGSPEDFQWLVNHLHEKGLGVFLDWVPGHFPTDSFSLGRFDGTALYEHEDPRKGFHPHWSTYIFNFGRYEVSNFIIANAIFWLKKMHIDGLRVDAVASMLYLDYGREEGDWIRNKNGGNENLESIEFFKHLNSVVHQEIPGALMIAEESTAFPGITTPVNFGGLGFDMKWNMGWMNDTLRFFSKDPIYRKYHQNDLTFGLIYAFSEKFVLAISHDEVVHGKKNLISKMPGDYWQRFANMRLLLSYQTCQPGKKLLFMGSEIAQWNEWNCKGEVEWGLLDYQSHRSIQKLAKELNHFYIEHPALWEKDFSPECFAWIDFSDSSNSVIAYLRKSSQETLLCVHNFTPNYYAQYYLHLPSFTGITEIFNTDAEQYGGSGKMNTHIQLSQEGVIFQLSPLATLIFKID